MGRFILFAGVIAMLVSWNESSSRKDRSYFPLAIGNHWEYLDTLLKDRESEHVIRDVIGDTIINDTSYFILQYFENAPSKIGFYRNESGIVYHRSINGHKEHILIPSLDSIGRSFVVTDDSMTSRRTLLETNATFKTPDREYNSLLCLKYENLTTQRTYFMYFKKGVGFVGLKDNKDEFAVYLKSYSVK